MKILLSIKPEYAEKILCGEKKYEFRRRIPTHDVDSILIYASSPQSRVIGEVDVTMILSMPPKKLWIKTKEGAGISRTTFENYFKDCSTANAFVLGDFKKFKRPQRLTKYNIQHPPQSFVYIK